MIHKLFNKMNCKIIIKNHMQIIKRYVTQFTTNTSVTDGVTMFTFSLKYLVIMEGKLHSIICILFP